MEYVLLLYRVVDGFADKRDAFRREHLDRVEAAHASGKLLLAGAYGDPITGAALLFRTAEIRDVEEFARADPYVTSGLVLDWMAVPWHVVVGGEHFSPSSVP